MTPKTDVFAFGVVLAELITGRRALVRENQEPKRTKSLITLVNFQFNYIYLFIYFAFDLEKIYNMQ